LLHSAGWKTALETIAANSKPTVIEQHRDGGIDPQLLASMHDKWSRTELELQEKLHEMQLKVRNTLCRPTCAVSTLISADLPLL
jgi:hypothetical protein